MCAPQLLTTANPAFDEDQMMFEQLGLRGKRAFADPLKPPPGHVEEPMIEPPVPPPRHVPTPSTPQQQPAMHAAAK